MTDLSVKQRFNYLSLILQGVVAFLFLYQLELIIAGLTKIEVAQISSFVMLITALLLSISFSLLQRRKCLYPDTLHSMGRIHWILALIIIGCIFILLLLWLLAIGSPDLSWDGNAYHIPPISLWASHGGIYWIDQPYRGELLNGYPKGVEVIAYGTTVAFGNNFLNTANLWFLPLGTLGIVLIAIVLGVRSLPTAIAAGALFLVVPINMNQSPTTYTDAAFAACTIAFTALWLENLKMERPSISNLFILGAAASLVISAKSSGFLIVGLAVLIWVFVRIWDHAFKRQSRGNVITGRWLARGFFTILITGVVALSAGGFWYIRNWVHMGSPLYPAGLTVGGKVIFPGSQITQVMAEQENTPVEFSGLSAIQRVGISWLQGLSRWPESIRGYDSRFGGLGFLWLLAGIPGVLMVLILGRKITYDRRSFLILLMLISLTFILMPMNWWSRYIVWIYALGLPVFALMMQYLFSDIYLRRHYSIILGGWGTLVLFIAAFEGIYCAVDNVALAIPGSIGSNPLKLLQRQTWIWPAAYLNPEMQGTVLEDLIVHGKNVAIGPHGDADYYDYIGLVGELAQPIGERSITFVGEDVTTEELRKGCFDYLLWDETVIKSNELITPPTEEALGFTVNQLAADTSSVDCP